MKAQDERQGDGQFSQTPYRVVHPPTRCKLIPTFTTQQPIKVSQPSLYWSQFPDFDHDETGLIQEEFFRLSQQQNCEGDDAEAKDMRRKEWGESFRTEFTQQYGEDASSLEGWQSLCREVGLEDIPESVEGCRRVSYIMIG